MSSTVTILELAKEVYRQNKWLLPEGGNWSYGDLEKAHLSIMGGCSICESSIAAYNAYPSRDGYWRCADCIGEDGWHSSTKAYNDIFAPGTFEDEDKWPDKIAGPKMVRFVWSDDVSTRFYADSWEDVAAILEDMQTKENLTAVFWPDDED